MLMHSKIKVGGRGDPAGRPQDLGGMVGEPRLAPATSGGDFLHDLLGTASVVDFRCATAARVDHFIPVVAMPVVIKRCKKANTSVIGNRVTTVIAST